MRRNRYECDFVQDLCLLARIKEFHIGCGLRILSVNTCPEPAGARADGRTMTSLSTSRQTPVAEVFCPMSSEKSVKIDRNPQQHAAVVDGQTNYAVCPPPEGLQKNGFCHVSSDIESFFYRQVASAGFSRSQWFLLALAADQTPSFHHDWMWSLLSVWLEGWWTVCGMG